MNLAINKLANAVFKKPLEECSLDELDQLARQHPYFGPAQLLLAKKLSIVTGEPEDNSSMYEEQVQKTSLYFQNRVWLHHLLNNDVSSNPVTEDHSTITEKEIPVANEEQYQATELTVNENRETEIISGPVNEETIEQTGPMIEITDSSVESIAQSMVHEHGEVLVIPEPDNEGTTEQTVAQVEMPSLKIEPITANTGIVFEPYHTVDYFASQGIKFKEDEKPKDRFSVQLKSFTEWLKTMKRIPASEIPSVSDVSSEKKVEQMAEYSIAERHVITEAMAEVWIKQGNKAKAEDIYRKLSLLDPSKSSYFATKIEELKKTS